MGLLAVGLLGVSDAISVAIRRTVVQILAPDNMRGRATSFLTVFAQTVSAPSSRAPAQHCLERPTLRCSVACSAP
jgi:hypothetical protein